jgi:glutaredoxin
MNQWEGTGTTQNAVRKSKAQKYNVEWVKIKVENHNGEAKKKKKKETKTTQARRTSPQIKAIDQIVQRNDPKPLPDTLKT